MYIIDNISEDPLTQYQISEILSTLEMLIISLQTLKQSFSLGEQPTLKSIISALDRIVHENLR